MWLFDVEPQEKQNEVLSYSDNFNKPIFLRSLLPGFTTGFYSGRRKGHLSYLSNYQNKASLLSSKHRATKASRSTKEDEKSLLKDGERRPPFQLNLAVVLAGFAFEAYNSPLQDMGKREIDAEQCQTVFLSESFLREVYDGQLFIKLRKGVDLPALDPWGTSDPYVIFQLDGQVSKSSVKWAMANPTWNEDFYLNIRINRAKSLQIAVWDANLLTPHKLMGNGLVNLEKLCDGNLHEIMVDLEGIARGGKISLEVKYNSYDQIFEEKQWWSMPFVSEFLNSSLGPALRIVLGSDSLNSSRFVESAFGLWKNFDYHYLKSFTPNNVKSDSKHCEELSRSVNRSNEAPQQDIVSENSIEEQKFQEECDSTGLIDISDESNRSREPEKNDLLQAEYFWKTFANVVNQTVFQKHGFSLPEIKRWDSFDLLNRMSTELQRSLKEKYVESGLATGVGNVDNKYVETGIPSTKSIPLSPLDVRKASHDLLCQTETIFGALALLAATFSQQKRDSNSLASETNRKDNYENEGHPNVKESNDSNGLELDFKKAEEMRQLFSSAESAMEAWAMLATSLGHTSFIKSEFEKICFLDNVATDTQVAIWRDSARRRLVVAFRGTEQAKWKDLLTDLMILPAGLNPERLGLDLRQEVQVHSGFLNAYDSVRNKLLMLIKCAIGYHEEDNHGSSILKWNVYVTGHSLGGALATLLTLELSISRMAKHGVISVTMYNFGSPRVGNRRFAELYNANVKDSWRVVNHRDIIPTIPRLMGYFHVAQPVYLAAGDLEKSLLNAKFRGDGYECDVIGEATPDIIVGEFLRGEKQLIEKILHTEINLLQSIRDGTALMQHMEDFYYIALLESVRSNYTQATNSNSSDESIPSAA
ncbi:hypothetical protein HPP92_012271 [Vanilla planifolia]|uniref:C2 domain-containing protein n=1 Tax=Vanilla planifolia TaxID=51239 RepID=A0A835R186_VANPL|nr:hypothetical protein HPP92_012271 [Vanilla planifolia]